MRCISVYDAIIIPACELNTVTVEWKESNNRPTDCYNQWFLFKNPNPEYQARQERQIELRCEQWVDSAHYPFQKRNQNNDPVLWTLSQSLDDIEKVNMNIYFGQAKAKSRPGLKQYWPLDYLILTQD